MSALTCQGVDDSTAECIVDLAMSELGPKAFDGDLSGERQARMAEFARRCVS